ncbi:hypothetical protein Sgly_1929 [Syntrophobotulus glycolicus DSM 8271]|uniref:Uncharacterized protein n=2 Tax=Syntrophobotulus TaxID=51196 RepID=F0T0T6_SYNGF|nr:hypothetical protein Sgly_1929 [Syntrophobotulus glycolicus DSM 8271]
MKCIYLAEGGLEWAKASLSTNPEWSGGTMSYPDDEVKLSVKKNEEDYLVISEVESGLARRKIQVTLQKREGNIEITRYEELHNQ